MEPIWFLVLGDAIPVGEGRHTGTGVAVSANAITSHNPQRVVADPSDLGGAIRRQRGWFRSKTSRRSDGPTRQVDTEISIEVNQRPTCGARVRGPNRSDRPTSVHRVPVHRETAPARHFLLRSPQPRWRRLAGALLADVRTTQSFFILDKVLNRKAARRNRRGSPGDEHEEGTFTGYPTPAQTPRGLNAGDAPTRPCIDRRKGRSVSLKSRFNASPLPFGRALWRALFTSPGR